MLCPLCSVSLSWACGIAEDLACFIFAQVEVLVLSGARNVTFGLHCKIDIVIGQSVLYVPGVPGAKQTYWINGRDGGADGMVISWVSGFKSCLFSPQTFWWPAPPEALELALSVGSPCSMPQPLGASWGTVWL